MKGRMVKTIKEIAAECGVSEQAVRGWCRRNHVAKDAKGSFALSESQKNSIYLHYLVVERNEVSQLAKASCETCETSETVLISMLQKELDRKDTQLSVKDEQLAVKDEQIRELNARLAECSAALLAAQETARAAQALHAGTIQQQLSDGEDHAAGVPDEQSAPNNRRWFSRFFRR